MSDLSPSHPAPTGGQTAFVALGQGAVMAFGGLLALLIAQWFGKTSETDAFFAAYGIYGIGVTFTQSFRLTAVPRLVEGDPDASTTEMLGATLVVTAALTLPMLLGAELLGGVIVDYDPRGVATDTLRILAIALGGQMFAAMLTTVLTVRGAFRAIGYATLLVGLVSTAVFLVTRPALGIFAAAIGLGAGGLWLSIILGAELARRGWRPTVGTRGLRRMCADAGRLGFASVTFMAQTLLYVIAVAVASRLGEGEATIFAYAYMLGNILLGLTANVSAVLRSPSIVASRDRTAEATTAGVSTFRFTLVLAGPLLGMAVLAGEPVVGLVLGSAFGGSVATSVVATLLALTGWIVATAAGLFAIIELLARHQLKRLAAVAVGQVMLLAGAAIAGANLFGTPGVAAGLSLASLAATAAQLRLAFGRSWRQTVGAMGRACAREAVVLMAAFGPPLGLTVVLGDSGTVMVAAVALGGGLAAVATRLAWPDESRALLRFISGGRGERAGRRDAWTNMPSR